MRKVRILKMCTCIFQVQVRKSHKKVPEWLTVFIDATPYKDGVFRVQLTFPDDFPASAPKGYMITKIFHPNISPTGEICVNTLKKDWDPSNWKLRNIFEVIHTR